MPGFDVQLIASSGGSSAKKYSSLLHFIRTYIATYTWQASQSDQNFYHRGEASQSPDATFDVSHILQLQKSFYLSQRIKWGWCIACYCNLQDSIFNYWHLAKVLSACKRLIMRRHGVAVQYLARPLVVFDSPHKELPSFFEARRREKSARSLRAY